VRPIAGMRVREELSHRGFPLVADGCLFLLSFSSLNSLFVFNQPHSLVRHHLYWLKALPFPAMQNRQDPEPCPSHIFGSLPLPFLESRAVRGEISLTLREGIPHSRSRKLEVSLFGRLHLHPPRLKGTDEPGVR